VQALTGLTTSSDARLAKIAKKFLGSVVSDALRTDVGADEGRAGGSTPPAPNESISDSAVFWRAEEKKRLFHEEVGVTYEVRLADGNGGVWKCRARDVGDTVPMNGSFIPAMAPAGVLGGSASGVRRSFFLVRLLFFRAIARLLFFRAIARQQKDVCVFLLCYCATTALVWQNVINSPAGARLRDARTTDDAHGQMRDCGERTKWRGAWACLPCVLRCRRVVW
jgi:hypothetical protein